jgi:pimeloyl-ACP methyl ester carboxylesterase
LPQKSDHKIARNLLLGIGSAAIIFFATNTNALSIARIRPAVNSTTACSRLQPRIKPLEGKIWQERHHVEITMNGIATLSTNQQLSYTTAGREYSPGLILIHDWMSHRDVWAQTVEVLKFSHRCVAVDLLGFGDSPKPNHANYSIPAQAQRVLQLADDIGLEHFDLMGHSMGGQIALYLAAKLAPERVDRLVIVAGVVSGRLARGVENLITPLVALGAQLPWLYDLAQRLSHYRLFAYTFFRPWFYKMSTLPFPTWEKDRQNAFQRAVHKSAYKSLRAMRALDLTSELAGIKRPILGIYGRQDQTVPLSEGMRIQHHAPDNHVRTIEDCGHFPMYEQRDSYLDFVLAFLRQQGNFS